VDKLISEVSNMVNEQKRGETSIEVRRQGGAGGHAGADSNMESEFASDENVTQKAKQQNMPGGIDENRNF